MELRDAIDQLGVIRSQLARTERLRCLRAVPVAFSAVAALAAAVVQGLALAEPLAEPLRYLVLWVGTAAVSAVAAALEIAFRLRRSPLAMANATTRLAWEQFAPVLFAGAVLTAFVGTQLADRLWILPGLWQLLYGLGVLAVWRFLPRPTFLVGAFFLLAGTASLWLGENALEPWVMGLPFAVGQLALGAILHRLENEEGGR